MGKLKAALAAPTTKHKIYICEWSGNEASGGMGGTITVEFDKFGTYFKQRRTQLCVLSELILTSINTAIDIFTHTHRLSNNKR